MNLFDPIVDATRQHPNFINALLPNREAQRDLFMAWAEGFVDRDGKLVEEFQTTFNSSFWEIYLNAVFKEYSFELDWTHKAPDFCVRAGGHEFIVEATTANAAQGKPNEWDKKLHPDEIKRIKLYELNKEAIIRLSNAISSKLKKYKDLYSKLPHVRNKPFVIAVAPFEQPYFNLQHDRPIRALLYDYYVDEDEYMQNPLAFPSGPRGRELGSIQKDNGAEICLGIFNDPAAKEISAIMFSCTATWGKLSAMTETKNENKVNQTVWATAPTGSPTIGDPSRPEHQEKIFDGLQVYHNPYASRRLSPTIFRGPRIIQHYQDQTTGEWEHEGQLDALLYRQVLVFRFGNDTDVGT